VVDAVVVGSFLISLLRHADRVGIACQAQLANIIAPIRTVAGGDAWRQPIFFPFADVARLARGQVLRVELRGPSVETAGQGQTPLVTATATHDPETGQTAVFLAHRGRDGATNIEVDLRALGDVVVLEHRELCDDDVRATNDAAHPDRVAPRPGKGANLEQGRLVLSLPPVSWTALRIGAP